MTPSEEKALLKRVEKDIRKEAEAASKEVFELIGDGVEPRKAVDTVNKSYRGKYAALFAAALSDVLSKSVTAEAAMKYKVGDKPLSSRVYANERRVRALVKAAVANHVRGYQDSRKLALELYEGYGFKTKEKLRISSRAKIVPKYMKDLLRDAATVSAMSKAFAKAQAKALKTGALRASYLELLAAIDKIEDGVGNKHLEKKLQVAYEEKVRYHSNRIAQTELHREYSRALAQDFYDDPDIQFVQYELAPTHPITDICDYYAKANMYGLGAGVFPAKECPVPPMHPFCRCQLSPRLDLFGKLAKNDAGAQQRFFNSLSVREQKLVAGTKDNLAKLKKGQDITKVWNSGRPKEYRVRTVGEIGDGTT